MMLIQHDSNHVLCSSMIEVLEIPTNFTGQGIGRLFSTHLELPPIGDDSVEKFVEII